MIGDSLAFDSRVPLRHRPPRWETEENFSFARDATETARDLRKRAADDVPLPPVIHVSTGTADDPSRPRRFRTAIRTVMRAAGKHRCVVWANIWRPSVGELTFTGLNKVLAKEPTQRFGSAREALEALQLAMTEFDAPAQSDGTQAAVAS